MYLWYHASVSEAGFKWAPPLLCRMCSTHWMSRWLGGMGWDLWILLRDKAEDLNLEEHHWLERVQRKISINGAKELVLAAEIMEQINMWMQGLKSKGKCIISKICLSSELISASTYLMSCISVWIVACSRSRVMSVGLMESPSPFVSALTTLSNWSPNSGIASTGTAWYTACRRLFCPPWLMKRRAFVWPGVNNKSKSQKPD